MKKIINTILSILFGALLFYFLIIKYHVFGEQLCNKIVQILDTIGNTVESWIKVAIEWFKTIKK